jgi:hypothetical protein
MAKKSSKVVRESPAVVPGMMRSSKAQREQEERWRAESDLRTLTEAEEICDDPKRHKAAKSMARQKAREMTKIAGGKY